MTVLVKLEMLEAAKNRAEAMGIQYTTLIDRAGISRSLLKEGYMRARYADAAKKKGYAKDAPLGAINKAALSQFCLAFMLNAEDWIVENPPMETVREGQQENKNAVDESGVEDVLIALRDMAKVQQAILAELQKQKAQDDTNTVIESKLGTIVRTLDGIDNKAMAIVTETQRIGGKQDQSLKFWKKLEPEVKTISEIQSGVLAKVEKVRAVLDRIASR